MNKVFRCDHFTAEPVGPTIGTQLPDGRWRFTRRYFCATCSTYFTESNVQDLERRVHERPDGPLSRRVDQMWGDLRAIKTMIEPFKGPKPGA